MVKTLEEFNKNGRKPEYLKNGDIITMQLASQLVGHDPNDEELEEKYGLVQARLCEDSVGLEPLYQTIYRKDTDTPWTYLGLCKDGESKNLSPDHAKKIYVCSRYQAESKEELAKNVMDAVSVCQVIHDKGDIPIAPHLYWTRFLSDSTEEDREYGLKMGLEALQECDGMIVVLREDYPEEKQISKGMGIEIASAVARGLEPVKIRIPSDNNTEKR